MYELTHVKRHRHTITKNTATPSFSSLSMFSNREFLDPMIHCTNVYMSVHTHSRKQITPAAASALCRWFPPEPFRQDSTTKSIVGRMNDTAAVAVARRQAGRSPVWFDPRVSRPSTHTSVLCSPRISVNHNLLKRIERSMAEKTWNRTGTE